MKLTVVSVAFPFVRLSADTAGGAEQVLINIDRSLMQAGHRSMVVGAEGSEVCGELVPVPQTSEWGDAGRRATHAAVRRELMRTCASRSVDIIHLHGVDFHNYMPPEGVRALVTLHLPLSWYPRQALLSSRPDTWFNTVSASQYDTVPPGIDVLGPIDNGVAVESFAPHAAARRRAFALVCRFSDFRTNR